MPCSRRRAEGPGQVEGLRAPAAAEGGRWAYMREGRERLKVGGFGEGRALVRTSAFISRWFQAESGSFSVAS
jgi:hypothetical protein